MYRTKIIRYSIAAAVLGAPVVLADDGRMPQDSQHTQMDKDAQKQAMLARASKLIGTNVYNDAGESLGEINELVLDGSENRIGYAVLSFGGWLGIGDKRFAIPWNQFEQKGTDLKKLYLNVAKDQLKNAPGFDKNRWPDSADRTYWESVDKYYPHHDLNNAGAMNDRTAAPDKMAPQPDRPVADAGNPAGTTPPADANRSSTNTPQEKGIAWTRKVSAVIGADVKNSSNESLGDVKDLVIDTSNGHVRYAVVSFGGWLGIGDKLFAVPMNALQGASGREYFVMNVTKDQMKNAPGFNDNAWPDFASPQWSTTNDAFYGGDGRTRSEAARTE